MKRHVSVVLLTLLHFSAPTAIHHENLLPMVYDAIKSSDVLMMAVGLQSTLILDTINTAMLVRGGIVTTINAMLYFLMELPVSEGADDTTLPIDWLFRNGGLCVREEDPVISRSLSDASMDTPKNFLVRL